MALPKRGNAVMVPTTDPSSYEVVPGGHLGLFWPEELIVVDDPSHFLFDHAEPDRTEPSNPGMQSLVGFVREKGVPGRPVVWQQRKPDGKVESYLVDGRRRRIARSLVNQELARKGYTGERLEVIIRNDLNPVQLREIVAEVNEGAEPPSLPQRVWQACALVDEYRREFKARHPDRTADETQLCRRCAEKFRGTDAKTIERWTHIPRLAYEAQAIILRERAPVEALDALEKLEPEMQERAAALAASARSPRAALSAIQTFARSLREAARTEPRARAQPAEQWRLLDKAALAHKPEDPNDPRFRALQEVLSFRRCEIDLEELLQRLDVPPYRPARSEKRIPPPRTPTPLDLRTRQERASYDQQLLDMLHAAGRPVLAHELGTRVSGTPEQLRASLRRLVEAGCVVWNGRAAGTRYQAVKGKCLPAADIPRRKRPKAPNMKTRSGRQVFARSIYEAISAQPLSIQDLRKRCGGTASQVQRLLEEMMEAGSVKHSGSTYVATPAEESSPGERSVETLDGAIALRFESAKTDEKITCSQLVAELKVTYKEAFDAVQRLIADGLVKSHGRGRGTWYGPAQAEEAEDSEAAAADESDDAVYDVELEDQDEDEEEADTAAAIAGDGGDVEEDGRAS